jgi:HEAT repeat protein
MAPAADRPKPEGPGTRRAILEALAGGDSSPALAGLDSGDDRVRATALAALGRAGLLTAARLTELANDHSPRVRRELAEMLATTPILPLTDLLGDADDTVVETACWSAGEHQKPEAVSALVTIATSHSDSLCREAAVAALGAIGAPSGLDAILAAMDDRATVRRRAVLALAPFDDPRVDEALQKALGDRDWQVRQAAEDLLE